MVYLRPAWIISTFIINEYKPHHVALKSKYQRTEDLKRGRRKSFDLDFEGMGFGIASNCFHSVGILRIKDRQNWNDQGSLSGTVNG